MILKIFNPDRTRYVIQKGIPPPLLLEFFKSNQKRLIPTGMKLDSVPKDSGRAFNLFINMPEKAIPIAYEWFLKRFPEKPSISINDVLTIFLLHEYDISPIEFPEKIPEYCRFILLNLLSKEPSEVLVSFMKTPIVKKDVIDINIVKEPENLKQEEISDIATPVLELVKDYDKDRLAALSDSSLFALIPLSTPTHFNDIKVELKRRIEGNELHEKIYQNYISLIEKYQPKEFKPSLVIKNYVSLKTEVIDPSDYYVFGVVSNILEASRTIFIKVICLLKDGVIFKPTSDQRRIFFPEHGDIIWLSRGHRKVLEKGEFGIFSIALDENWDGKGAKYLVKELQNQVYPVSQCEYSLDEPARVEYWLTLHEYNLAKSKSYILLNDNLLIKPNFTANLLLDFEKPMDLYENAEIFSIDGVYYSPEIGSATSYIDFSSTETYFKKLIKSGLADKLNLSKDVQNNLINEFNLIKKGQNSRKIEDIITNLNELLSKRDLFLELISELEKSPKVQQSIREGIERAVSEKTSQANSLRAQIVQLEEKKKSLEKVTTKEEEQIKKLRQGLANDIKSTFEKAVQDGRKTMSEIALFQAFIPPHQISEPNIFGSSLQSTNFYKGSYSLAIAPLKIDSLEDQFRSLRLRTSQIVRLFEAIKDVCALGLTPAFKGCGSRIFATSFANSYSVESVVDINIGPGATSIPELLDSKMLLDSSKIFLIKNFDISPISLYGHVLVDLCYKKFLAGTTESGINAFFTFEDSGLGLNYPQSLDFSFVIIDTDSLEFEDEIIDLDGFQEFIKDGGAVDDSAKKALFNVIRSIKTFEGIDQPQRFAKLCGFMRKTYFNRFIIES